MQTTQQQGGQLKRTMKTRHLIMLSLGGVIGTGLFFNTGYIISTTGAAGTLLAYLISIPLGIRKATRDGTRFDTWTSAVIIMACSRWSPSL